MVYKWCIVPQCTNTSINSPKKLFPSVPTNPKRRKMWLQLARRDPDSILTHSNVFICEDHFDMETDTKNYMQYKMGFSQKILWEDGAMPTKFHCQEDGKSRLPDAESKAKSSRKAFLKRQSTDLVAECMPSPTETHAESLQKVIEPEELPMMTQYEKTITSLIITVEKPVQVTTKVNMRHRNKVSEHPL